MVSDYLVDSVLPRSEPCGEDALIARASVGDHEAYATLVRREERLAYRVAVAITGSRADAQEAVQNAYVKAYRSLRRFRRGATFRPWLLRIVVNEAHNVRRAEQRHERLAARAGERYAAVGVGADETVVAREEMDTILRALAQLPEADRLVIALRYFAQLPDAEAAELAEASTGAYRVRLLRARRRLEALLDEAHG
jgi:RNA polymerase sigma-70 factor (ECF subfamily)